MGTPTSGPDPGLAEQFARQGQPVVEVPFDAHLRPGGVIAGTDGMSRATRHKFIEVAAALAEHFPHRRRPSPRAALGQLADQGFDQLGGIRRHRRPGFGAEHHAFGYTRGLGGFGDGQIRTAPRRIQPLSQRRGG